MCEATAFYATPSYQKSMFNYFREEPGFYSEELLSPANENIENVVLRDTNLVSIKNSPEFHTNKNSNTPTNRLCTSLFQKDRLSFLLQYAFAYVKTKDGLQKHIMRYPQIFATKAIEKKLDEGIKKGIIWHTQGSGKTALAYYNVKFLTDYFNKSGVVPKFYFIVDRIDLLTQASREFKSRGLVVHNISSKEDFAKDIKSVSAIHSNSGKPEITVVNIQKFQDDANVVKSTDYQINIQRVFFLDEVHRSYNPRGSFLANLELTDTNAIKIGLTGTPLILNKEQYQKSIEGDTKKFASKSIFGDYIHKYYYNLSIKDGYTLRLIREEIDTSYKLTMQKALDEIKILKGEAERTFLYSHRKFVEPMLQYIVEDFQKARIAMNDKTIGGMVICDSSDQAKMLYEVFQEQYEVPEQAEQLMAAETAIFTTSGDRYKVKSAALILHDIGDKQFKKDQIEDFKEGKIDLLFVFNMLLTGFDAPRLKKLYIGRVIKAHNLLQALTRVNRTYKDYRYGYVVDFADIQKQFDIANRDYFNELQDEL
jgi:type I restriction enzyme R subunit